MSLPIDPQERGLLPSLSDSPRREGDINWALLPTLFGAHALRLSDHVTLCALGVAGVLVALKLVLTNGLHPSVSPRRRGRRR